MKTTRKYFKLFASCIAVSGHFQSTICDLQKEKIYIISNDFKEFLDLCDNSPVKDVIKLLHINYNDIIEEIQKLEERELGFWTETPDYFPKIDFEFDSPQIISNSIIEVTNKSLPALKISIPQLLSLGCKQYEFRILGTINQNILDKLMQMFKDSKARGIIFVEKFSNNNRIKEIEIFIKSNPRIIQYIIHSCNVENLKGIDFGKRGLFTSEKIDNNHCGFISPNKFVSNIASFSESKNYNSCLNKKISIDYEGNIKNCLSINVSFGNIFENRLINIINKKTFQKLWKINKDQINICNVCEFRYVCTDCRAYIENPKNIYSKPVKCGYDPYTGTWEDWEKNPLKQKAIKHYGFKIKC